MILTNGRSSMGKQYLTIVSALAFLTLSVMGVYVVRAQSQFNQLSVSISPSGNIEALAVYFTATIEGGTLPYSFQWYVNDTIIEGATASHYTFNPSSTGTYTIYATVTDSLNASATSNIVTVTAKSYLQVDLVNHNYLTTTAIGQPVSFSALVVNGRPPYRYQWYYRLYAQHQFSPIGSTLEGDKSQNFTFSANSTGHYLITVRVWDSQNIEGYFMSLPPGIWVNVIEPQTSPSASTTLPSQTPTLTPSSSASTTSPTPSSSPSPTIPEFPAGIFSSALMIIISVIVLIIRNKREKKLKI